MGTGAPDEAIRARPLVGHFPAYGRDPLGFATRVAAAQGGLAAVRFGPVSVYVLTDPAAIEEVLITRHRDFGKSIATRRIGAVTGNGLLISEGETWREHRRGVQPAFHSDRVRAWADVMVREAAATATSWGQDATRDIHSDMGALTLRIVVRTLLGSDLEQREIEFGADAMSRLTHYFETRLNGLALFIPDFVPTPTNRRMRAQVRQLDEVIYRLIADRRATTGDSETPGDDVISMLLAFRREDGRPLTDREIRDEVMTLFLAGHETTALNLTWTLWSLGGNPDIQDRLQSELSEVVGDRLPTLDDMPRLKYTEAVVNESLRLYPPAYAVSRQTIRPTQIGDRKVGKRSIALVSIWATHRNPERFPDPEAFKPERWLDGLARRLPRGAYLPFAEGPRKCIGATFAMQEAVLALATLCSRARFTPVTDHEIKPIAAITLRPSEPVLMRIQAMPR